jgi:hypothetical protein
MLLRNVGTIYQNTWRHSRENLKSRNNQQHHLTSSLPLTKNISVDHKLFHSLLLHYSLEVKGKVHPRTSLEGPERE